MHFFFAVAYPRHFQNRVDSYRYGFNGMEKDDEVKGNGNSYTTQFRQYDPRIGRWMSVDALTDKFPELSPYQFADNTPLWATDIDGLEAFFIHGMASSPNKWRTAEFKAVKKTLIQLTNNTEVNSNDGFDWSMGKGKRNGVAQNQRNRTRAAKRLAKYVVNNRAGGEEISLIGVSHGGNVAIQAAAIIYEQTGEQVNIITFNTTATHEKGNVENPMGNEGINDMIDIRTKDDRASEFVRGGGYNNEPHKVGQDLLITNDQEKWLPRHATKNADLGQIKNSSLVPMKRVPSRKERGLRPVVGPSY
ncbi:MAG: hypothetical protein HRT71_17095 [Flavobacteriales bacterium]|nr:hypothetical protein [Flavobacteriales bacterium]